MSQEHQPTGLDNEPQKADVIALPFDKWAQYAPTDKDADVILMRTSNDLSPDDESHPAQLVADGALSDREYARISALTSDYRRNGQSGVAHHLSHYAANRMRNRSEDESFETVFEDLATVNILYHRIQKHNDMKRRIAETGLHIVPTE